MIKNYLKTAWRNILHNKFYAAINIAGLTFGLVIGLFMLLWVQDELSFDAFNTKAPEIYRIGIVGGTKENKQIFNYIIAPVVPFAKAELPEVTDGVRIMQIGDASVKYKDKTFMEEGLALTDPSYFSVFDFHLVSSDVKNPFPDNNSVVITQTVARKYFGTDNAVGKTITMENDVFKVTGVVENYPANSSIKYQILFPINRFNQITYIRNSTSYNGTTRIKSMDADWINFGFETYLLLKPNTDITQLEKKLQAIHERNKPDDAPVPYLAQPLLQMHLYKADGGDGGAGTVRTFAVVAILILVIACINYVNLSTARSMLRAKEVSMRKIIGAGKFQLFLQFMVETALLFFIATLLSVGVIYVLMPFYNNFSGKQLQLDITNYQAWGYIGITLFGTLAASSIYPALLLSSFEPLNALKGKITGGIGNVNFRRVLVVLQFSISIVLIISTLIIDNQLKYIRSKNLGYDKENVFAFDMRRDMQKHYDAVRAELIKQTSILSVARSGGNIIRNNGWTGDNDWDGKAPNTNLILHPFNTDKDFVPFFKIKLSQGSNFTGVAADSTHFIINEAALSAMNMKDPIGKRLRVEKTSGTIIGVVKDFHYGTMRKKIEPAVLVYRPESCWRIYVKTTGNGAKKAIAAVQSNWKQYNSDIPFTYSFLDENFNQLYKSDEQTGALFNVFSALAIVISCLGLFGLATYSAQVKTREIGIRKVLGSSIIGIIRLLATEFVLLIILSIFIAMPIAWYAMNKWLQDFAYKADIKVWVFILAGSGATFIALLTISVQSIKAALANPVESLKNE